MKKLKIWCVLFLILCGSFPVKAQVAAENGSQATTPEAWLVQKSHELFVSLSTQEIKSRYLKLRRLCKEVFNPKEMPRLAMGKYWKEMSAGQQEDLQRLFFDYFVVMYGSLSSDFPDVSVQVTETVPSGRDLLMKAQVKIGQRTTKPSANSQTEKHPIADLQKEGDVEIMFAVRRRAGGYYIRDAKLEGQSIMMFLRSHLEREYKSAGFDMEKLLAGLRKKINDRYRAAEDLAKKNKA